MKRVLSILLLIAVLASAMACGGTQTGGDTSANDDSSSESSLPDSETELSDDLPEVNYNGREFNIIARTNFAYEFDAEQTGDILDDAIYARNVAVEERFGVKLITHPYDDGNGNASNVIPMIEQSVMAGDDAYQLGAAYTFFAAPASLSGSFANIYDVKRINLDKPWWEKGFTEEATINGKVYIATGDISLLFNEVTMSVFFNKQLADDLKLGDIYKTVKDGKWTFELMKKWCADAASDLNGDGKMDENDRFGIGVNRYTHVDCFIYAFNVPLTERDANGIPQLKINNEKMISLVEQLTALFHDSDTAYLSDNGANAFGGNMFESGQGLFMTSWLGNAAALRDMTMDFGIIPYPKWDEAQEAYSTYYLDRASCMVIPVTADYEFVGTIVEALAAESSKKVIPAFYDVTLKGKSVRDDESKEMIDLIRSGVRYDFANIYAYAFGYNNPGQILRALVWNNDTNFASFYSKNENTYLSKLSELLDKFQ